jgi:CheY-like chemotaxis protein/two-component sensor histidine kinase
VAHDFNNLLTAVMGSLELLRKRLPNEPTALRLLDAAMQGAERGASLTQRMLAFARQQDLRSGATDLASLLNGMRDLLDRSLGPQIDLQIRIGERLPPALVDANQVELALLNLAINARDAMPDGGTISVIVDAKEAGAEKGLAPGLYLRIQVNDTGCGMDAATLKKAVEPFFSTKPVGKGTGLGLSMVHGLAEQLGGALELSSENGKGTSVTLWLPAAAASARPAAEPAVPEETKSEPATILVVDDDALIAMSTVGMLQDLGHTVLEANSPKKALEILETDRRIDLLLTDHAMPGMTGTELAAIARRRRPDLPILLATGYAELPSGQQTELPRLSKPFHQSELREQVNRLLHDR